MATARLTHEDDTPRPAGRLARIGRADRLSYLALAIGFLVSRLAAFRAGVRYDAGLLPVALQYLEPTVLREHLLSSLWHLHSQPPLFNLVIGLVLKFSPLGPDRTFHLAWLAIGIALVFVVFRLLRALGLARVTAVVATVVITCSPTMILYENWFAYEYPLTLALTALPLAALRWADTGRVRWLATAAALAGACVLTRALLNPAWFALVIGALFVIRRPAGRWRPALVAAALPALLIGGVMAKNYVVFGQPTLSSWLGWNLQRVTLDEMPVETRGRLIENGTLSNMAHYPVFLSLDKYQEVSPPCPRAYTDVPALSEPLKHTVIDGITPVDNFNHECFLPVTDEALRNAIAAARAEPGYTARAIVGSFEIWSESSSQYAFVYDNRLKIDTWDEVYRSVVLLDVAYDRPVEVRAGWWIPIGTPGHRWRFSITVIVATLIAIAAGARSSVRLVRRRATGGSGPDAAIAVAGLTIAMVTVVGNVLEIGENNRFRFMVEPITFVVLAWFLDRAVRHVRARWTGRRTGPTADASGSEHARCPAVDGATPTGPATMPGPAATPGAGDAGGPSEAAPAPVAR